MGLHSVIPGLLDALIGGSRAALPAVNVTDCWPVELTSGDWLLWGVADPESGRVAGVTSTQEYPHASRQARNEAGEINGVIFCSAGDDDAKGVRDAAFRVLAAVEDLLRNDITQSLPGVWKTSLAEVRYLPARWSDYGGAVAEVQFTVQFSARI